MMIQKLLLSPLGPLIARLTRRKTFARNMARIFGRASPPDPWLIEGFWEAMTANDGLRVFPKLIRYLPERRLRRGRWVGAMQSARVPLKLIDGLDDPISGAHMARRYRELIACADITELPGIGHYPQIEAPAELLAAYLEFRSRLRESA
jgi:pimeloyl-ACP methyl ester carboxylesterase